MRTGLAIVLSMGLVCAGCMRGSVGVTPSGAKQAQSGTLNADQAQTDSTKKEATQSNHDAEALAELQKRKPPHVEIYSYNERLGSDAKPGMVSFVYQAWLTNTSSSQISEVSFCLRINAASTLKETFRSEPQVVSDFQCDRVPHHGTLEAFSHMLQPATLTFEVPAEIWTADSHFELLVQGAKAVTDESDLHDFGNLISYVLWHSDQDIESTFLKDPTLFKSHNSVGANPAMIAAANGSPAVLDFMLRHGVELKDHTPGGHDLMYSAVASQAPGMLSKVVSLGFSVNERYGASMRTPLMEAVNSSFDKSVKWLLAHGADPNAEDAKGDGPLDIAIVSSEHNASAAFDDLIAAKADFRHLFSDGSSLLYTAIICRNQPIFEKLVNLGLDVNFRIPKNGMTPLMLSARSGTNGISKFLLAKGAKLDAVDNKGQTVFDYAKGGNTLHTDEFFRRAVGIK